MNVSKTLLNFNHEISPTPLSDFYFNMINFFIAKGHDSRYVDVAMVGDRFTIRMRKQVTLAGLECPPYWEDVLILVVDKTNIFVNRELVGDCQNLLGISSTALGLLIRKTAEFQQPEKESA